LRSEKYRTGSLRDDIEHPTLALYQMVREQITRHHGSKLLRRNSLELILVMLHELGGYDNECDVICDEVLPPYSPDLNPIE
jgi:transposase